MRNDVRVRTLNFIKYIFVFTVTHPNGAKHEFETESLSYKHGISDLRVQYRKKLGKKKDYVSINKCQVRLKEKRGVS